MATNKLMEAAAEILAGSKSKASAMPMQKPEDSSAVVVGGPSQDVGSNKVGDDIYASAKMNSTAGSKSATAPTTKPSAASSDTQIGRAHV